MHTYTAANEFHPGVFGFNKCDQFGNNSRANKRQQLHIYLCLLYNLLLYFFLFLRGTYNSDWLTDRMRAGCMFIWFRLSFWRYFFTLLGDNPLSQTTTVTTTIVEIMSWIHTNKNNDENHKWNRYRKFKKLQ